MGVKFQHEGLALLVWLGYYQWFQRSFVTSVVMTNQKQHLNIYLIFVYCNISALPLSLKSESNMVSIQLQSNDEPKRESR